MIGIPLFLRPPLLASVAALVVFASPSGYVWAEEPAPGASTPGSEQDDTPEALVRHYVTERREAIKEKLKGVPLNLIVRKFKDDSLCHAFGEDFRQQRNVDLIAPILRVHGYNDPRLQHHLQYCPKLAKALPQGSNAGPYVGRQNWTLYEVDVDNNVGNGKELVLLEESYWKNISKFGPEIRHSTWYTVLDMANCTTRGGAGGGPAPTYSINSKVSDLDPETGLHGFVFYRGKYYRYDVLPEPKAPPLSIVEYDLESFLNFRIRCIYDSRDPKEFSNLESLEGANQ